jgi:putative heme degradation protein
MDTSKILSAAIAEAIEAKKATADRKITVKEVYDAAGVLIDKLDIGDKVIIDLEKV